MRCRLARRSWRVNVVAAIHVRLLTTTAAGGYTANLRARMLTAEAVTLNASPMRARFLGQESAVGNTPKMRTRAIELEAVTGASVNPSGYPKLRVRNIVVEALMEILEEVMATDVFPGIDPATGNPAVIRGLAFDVQKRPNFSNKIVEHTSGEESATSYWENPKWDYTLTFDYLPDFPKSVGDSDLRMMMGFFLNMRGRFQTWLFKDPDDYIVTAGFQKTFDGVTVDFNLARGMAGFYEPVGQLNTGQPLTVYLQADENKVIPVTPGPYVVTINHSAAMTAVVPVVHIGVTLMTEVVGAPGANQYNRAGGVFTFNSARQGQTATINYQYLVDPADYTVTLPNVVAFDTAPAAGAVVSASFQYYFVCRFKEDVTEYTKFMDKLWELNELNFRSIPQS
jgi:hypothetical protein